MMRLVPLRSVRALACLVLVAASLPAVAGSSGRLVAHREVLSSGMILLVAERPAIPIVTIRLRLGAGSVLDPPDASGLANLTAALLTRGTARRTGPELDRAIEFVGGSLEAEAGRDGVTVSLGVLKKDLGLGLDLLAEVVLEPIFPADELQRKARQIQGALKRSEEDPGTVAAREMARILYPGHPYAHPSSGTIESVGRLTRDQVIRFHREHYRPDGAIIAAVGDIAEVEIRRELQARFGRWPAPAVSRPQISQAPVQPPVMTRLITRELTQATVDLARPGIRQTHPDYFALQVANYILGGGSASRLYSRVRGERGLAYGVWSGLATGLYGSSYSVSLQTRLDGVAEAVRLVKEEMARMGREAVSADELDLARSYLIGSFPLRLDTSGKVAGLLLAIEEQGLGLDYPERFKREIAKVTTADVQRVAARYMDPATFSMVTVGK